MRRIHLHPEISDNSLDLTFEHLSEIFKIGETLSTTKTQTVKSCQLHGREYILKRYLGSGLFSSIRLAISQSRAHLSFRFAKYLAEYKISCPRHLAVATKIGIPKSITFLLMEKAPGIPLFDYIQADSSLELSKQAINNIAALISSIHLHGIAHGDMHTRNLIIAPDDNVCIIDLDNVRFSKRRTKNDIQRFTSAIQNGKRYNTAIIKALEKSSLTALDTTSYSS